MLSGHVFGEFQFASKTSLANVALMIAYFQMDIAFVCGESTTRLKRLAACDADMLSLIVHLPSMAA